MSFAQSLYMHFLRIALLLLAPLVLFSCVVETTNEEASGFGAAHERFSQLDGEGAAYAGARPGKIIVKVVTTYVEFGGRLDLGATSRLLEHVQRNEGGMTMIDPPSLALEAGPVLGGAADYLGAAGLVDEGGFNVLGELVFLDETALELASVIVLD